MKTPRSVCYDILREILREARQFNPKEFRIVASAAVVEMLLDEESQHLAGLSDFIGKPISLQAEHDERHREGRDGSRQQADQASEEGGGGDHGDCTETFDVRGEPER